MSDFIPLAASLALRRRLLVSDEQSASDPLGMLSMGAFRLSLQTPDLTAAALEIVAAPSASSANVPTAAAEVITDAYGAEETVMKLAPPNCGPLELRIAARSGGVSVTMICTSAETRNALLTMLPRLRDSLAARGIPLLFGGITAQTESARRRDSARLDDFA